MSSISYISIGPPSISYRDPLATAYFAIRKVLRACTAGMHSIPLNPTHELVIDCW